MCKYDIVISDTVVDVFLNWLFLLLWYYHSFMRNQEEIEIELQKKVHRRICVRAITFLTARPPFYVIFCFHLRLLPFPSDILIEWPCCLETKWILKNLKKGSKTANKNISIEFYTIKLVSVPNFGFSTQFWFSEPNFS